MSKRKSTGRQMKPINIEEPFQPEPNIGLAQPIQIDKPFVPIENPFIPASKRAREVYYLYSQWPQG